MPVELLIARPATGKTSALDRLRIVEKTNPSQLILIQQSYSQSKGTRRPRNAPAGKSVVYTST